MENVRTDSLGTRLVNLRTDKHLTQKVIAEKAGITKAMLSKYENNINVPRADILGKLADILETSTDYLLCRTNDPTLKKVTGTELELRRSDCFLKCRRLDSSLQEMVYHNVDVLYEYTSRVKKMKS